jgi:hypothetical protein
MLQDKQHNIENISGMNPAEHLPSIALYATQAKPYEIQSTPGEREMMKKLNRLLSLALPVINAGKEPDIESLAKEAGVNAETARDLLTHTMSRIDKLRNQADKQGKKKK